MMISIVLIFGLLYIFFILLKDVYYGYKKDHKVNWIRIVAICIILIYLTREIVRLACG